LLYYSFDPQGFEDGPNLYAYVHNNPLTHLDLLGLADVISGMNFWTTQDIDTYSSFQFNLTPLEMLGGYQLGAAKGLFNFITDPLSTAHQQHESGYDLLLT
jgi:hypothetical protein